VRRVCDRQLKLVGHESRRIHAADLRLPAPSNGLHADTKVSTLGGATVADLLNPVLRSPSIEGA
jgi:hypothetical protein